MKKLFAFLFILGFTGVYFFMQHYETYKEKAALTDAISKMTTFKANLEAEDKALEKTQNDFDVEKDLERIIALLEKRKRNLEEGKINLLKMDDKKNEKAKEIKEKLHVSLAIKVEIMDALLAFYQQTDVDKDIESLIFTKVKAYEKNEKELVLLISN